MKVNLISGHQSYISKPRNLSKYPAWEEKVQSINPIKKTNLWHKDIQKGRECLRHGKLVGQNQFNFLKMLSSLPAGHYVCCFLFSPNSCLYIKTQLSHHFPRKAFCDLLTRHLQHCRSMMNTSITPLPRGPCALSGLAFISPLSVV